MYSLKSYLFLLFSVISLTLFSQANQWVWLKGSNLADQPAVLGTQGTPAINNTPGKDYEACEWTDNSGNFWLLTFSSYLWKYDPVINMWTWINNGPANYATPQGVPSVNNYPGGIGFGAVTWTDLNNNLWLYGGNSGPGFTSWNANLWRYNIATAEWTWMKGPGACDCIAPNHGVKGVAAASNEPGARIETSCSWVDAAGDLWFFGGQACSGGCAGPAAYGGTYGDVWKYDIGTNNWIWMSGPSAVSQPAVYGTIGIPSTANTPGGRIVFASGKDAQGNFILFGGVDHTNTQFRNDLWRYNPATDEWTWLSGTNLINQPGSYVAKCVPSATNYPDNGHEVRTRWTDDCGNLWLFGPGSFASMTNSLWRYSVANDTWTWVTGTGLANQNGVYGVRGVYAATNHPGSRKGGNPWRYKTDFYMFGGANTSGTKNLNDLWKYTPDKPTASYTMSVSSNCTPAIVTFTNTSVPGCNEIKSYYWDFDDPSSGANNNSTALNPTHLYNTGGSYNIKLVVTNCTGSKDSVVQSILINGPVNTSTNVAVCSGQSVVIHGILQNSPGIYTQTFVTSSGCDSISVVNLSATNSPSVVVTPMLDTINSGNSITINSTGALTYSWSNGSTESAITVSPAQTTSYCVIGFNSAGCTDTVCSDIFVFQIDCDNIKIFVPTGFSPNGDGQNDELKLFTTGPVNIIRFSIFNRWGQLVFETSDITKTWNGTYNNVALDAGVFIYTLHYKCLDNTEAEISGNINLVR